MKRLFEFLVSTHTLLLNPCEGIRETPRGFRVPQPVLTQEEMKKLLLSPNLSLRVGIRDRAILELLYATGIRVGEMERLTIHDVDLLSGVIHVRRGKGGRARVLPLGKVASRWLKEYLEKIRPFYNRHYPQERALFLTQTGRALRQDILRPLVRGYAKKAGIKKKVSPHTLRHTCATHLLHEGADIVSLQRLLGHRHIDSTVLYTRVMPVEVKKTHQETHPREKGMR
mgnify:CR=1 FL=1